jgi:hypothetical protein
MCKNTSTLLKKKLRKTGSPNKMFYSGMSDRNAIWVICAMVMGNVFFVVRVQRKAGILKAKLRVLQK